MSISDWGIAPERMPKPALLRKMLKEKSIVTAMAAHNPLSAFLAEEAGFNAIWASGFELSASMGVPDASIISMGEHLYMTRKLCERVSIPVIADIDTGFGNAVNVHYAIRSYVSAGVAAVVMEDKNFPKDTSLREGGRQKLVPAEEFEGKVNAAIDARGNSGLVVIARTEALIAGEGVDEAISRATAYANAGADMILVHSKAKTPAELLQFVGKWDSHKPIVIVPTAYPEFDEQQARDTGKIGLVIYGNHSLRAAVTGMRETFAQIRQEGGAAGVSKRITPVKEVIALQGDAAMREIEKDFLR